MAALSTASHFDAYQKRAFAARTLSNTEEADHHRAWTAGDERAGCRLIESNLKAVFQVAREYRRWGVPLEDLVQQGSIGLLKAMHRFDPERDNSLRTYASYWIRAEIRDHVVRSYRMVRLGTTRTERRAIRAYRSRPVDSVRELVEVSGMPAARCELLLPLLRSHDRSLTARSGDWPSPQEQLPSAAPGPEELLHAARREAASRQRVAEALASLDARERRIVQARMLSDEPRTLEQLGAQLGVSRERIRQLENRAKQKMRDALREP